MIAQLIARNYEEPRLVFLAGDALVRMSKWDAAREATEKAIRLTNDPMDRWGLQVLTRAARAPDGKQG